MTIKTTDNPDEVFVSDAEAVILTEDMDWLKELTGNIKSCTDRRIIREAEHDFLEEMTRRYGGKVAGELLGKLWVLTKK